MKEFLLPLIICPEHIATQTPLHFHESDVCYSGDDIWTGNLICPQCQAIYSIRDGVADLAPVATPRPAVQGKYELDSTVGAYLWSQFGDLYTEDTAILNELVKPSDAYASWANLFSFGEGPFLDVGCAVGRLVLEAAGRGLLAVGVDLSHAFISAARSLVRTGRIDTLLTVEGQITQPFSFALPKRLRNETVEFIVGDALALPFRSDCFASLASLNILDKVPFPLRHLEELSRVGHQHGCELVVSDPYSWSSDVAAPSDWLGGTLEGPYAGRGIDNVRALLAGRDGHINPPYTTDSCPDIPWTIRNHTHHAEYIVSRPLYATR
ncbi:class I SAM-dependent methyltransferase [Desulfovibrio inopinatus]|uniref:class I SAM-dependent methyltransferase n=1 Tax=Desulfovibrio inopinatus TaxID=102109 RepID=UPI0004054185|nr:methyltransferase domain-containing protein [Desulfovibrio inopinatus]